MSLESRVPRLTALGQSSTDLASIIAAVSELEAEGAAFPESLRVAVLRNYTIEAIIPLLKYACYHASLQPEITLGDYDNVTQEILNPASHVYATKPDIVVLSLVLEHLDPACARVDWDPTTARNAVVEAVTELAARTTALIVVNTLLPPLHTENGISVATNPTHRVAKVESINAGIREAALAHPRRVLVSDWQRLLQRIGEDRAIDYRFWTMYRSPFKKDFLAAYAADIAAIGRALKGRAKKCVVLDCDNTIWGGVVGEEGVAGIALDRHEYPGRCYYEFQQAVVNLAAQGVLVALCSKNNEADVFEVLDQHPDALLKRSHLAAWRINWDNKADNLASLARELNLGLDSFVFVDDSDVECDLVITRLPEVTVLKTPLQHLYQLPQLLYRDRLFDGLSISEEDRQRTEMYAQARERETLKTSYETLDAYLSSLGLRAVIHRAAESELSRVTQLVSKTNQFNLTTRRHTEGQIQELAASPDAAVFTMSARDRFGDLGLVAVLIARREGRRAIVDSLLMSCRALGRKLEVAFVDACLDRLARDWAVDTLEAEYVPTPKNALVARFWDDLGLSRTSAGGDVTRYALPFADRPAHVVPFITVTEQ